MLFKRYALLCAVALWSLVAGFSGHAQDAVAVRVNDKALTEADMRLAEAEVGSDLGSLAGVARRRVLAEFLVETQLIADAAEAQKLTVPAGMPDKGPYWRRRGLREAYFEKIIAEGVSEAEVKAFYDEHIGGERAAQEEVRVRHILVDSEAKAKDVHQKILAGADFAQLASQVSIDPGSKDQGGDLGFIVRGVMVPTFEHAAFKLKPGEVSEPFETKYGWHVVKVDARRPRQVPPYESIKEQVRSAVIHYKAQQIVLDLRTKAKIEYVDPEIRQMVEAESAHGSAQKP